MVEGIKPLNGDGEDADDEDSSTLPPTQTLPVTLSADGNARATVDVPQTLDQGEQHADRDGLSGRQRRDR